MCGNTPPIWGTMWENSTLVSKPVPILSSVTGNSEVVQLEETAKKRFSHQTKSAQGKGGRVNASESL